MSRDNVGSWRYWCRSEMRGKLGKRSFNAARHLVVRARMLACLFAPHLFSPRDALQTGHVYSIGLGDRGRTRVVTSFGQCAMSVRVSRVLAPRVHAVILTCAFNDGCLHLVD
jgi:hypothetical protein